MVPHWKIPGFFLPPPPKKLGVFNAWNGPHPFRQSQESKAGKIYNGATIKLYSFELMPIGWRKDIVRENMHDRSSTRTLLFAVLGRCAGKGCFPKLSWSVLAPCFPEQQNKGTFFCQPIKNKIRGHTFCLLSSSQLTEHPQHSCTISDHSVVTVVWRNCLNHPLVSIKSMFI